MRERKKKEEILFIINYIFFTFSFEIIKNYFLIEMKLLYNNNNKIHYY